jgi:hypothetical protein
MSMLDDPTDDTFLNDVQRLLNRTNISNKNLHYQTSTGETGETTLEKVDTFRFMRLGNMKFRVHNYATQPTNNDLVKEKNLYILHNIPVEILEYIKMLDNAYFSPRDDIYLSESCAVAFHIDENNINIKKCEIYIINFNPRDLYSKSKIDNMTGIESPLYINTNSATYFPLTQDIRDILSEKKWDFSDFRCIGSQTIKLHDNGSSKIRICKNIYETEFSQDITIKFKHKYKIAPHISYYITPVEQTTIFKEKHKVMPTIQLYMHPIEENKIKVSIKSITKNTVVFKLEYGFDDEDIEDNYILHWKADGIVESNQVSLLD